MEPWLHALYDAEGMREVDRWAIEERGVPSLELMENAGRALSAAAAELAGEGAVRIVCGKGNNGGDGLVAARLLRETGFEAEALLLWQASEMTGTPRPAWSASAPARWRPGDWRGAAGAAVVVDAIFGTGFCGAPAPRRRRRSRRSTQPGAGPRLRHRLGGGRLDRRGRGRGSRGGGDSHLPRRQDRPPRRPRKAAAGELRIAPIGIPEGRPLASGGGVIDATGA